MPASKDLTCRTFSRLTAIYAISGKRGNPKRWFCLCVCGNNAFVTTSNLLNGNSKSCGCWNREVAAKRIGDRNRTHGRRNTTEYWCWSMMVQRCTNPKSQAWHNYGGRGIKVCKRWMKFENFLADMGERPKGLELDRIDNDGDYKPSNCRWTTRSENTKNQRPHQRNALGQYA